jgi:hypothetical protein
MENLIVGMFDEADQADEVVRDLELRGVPLTAIRIDAERAKREQSWLDRIGHLFSSAEASRRTAVVTARVADSLADEAVTVMRSHGAFDVDQRNLGADDEGQPRRRLRAEDFDQFDHDFQDHHQRNYVNTGYGYEMYSPAYRYGWNLGASERYGGRPWSDIEPDAHRSWEEHNPGTWDRYAEAIKFGWERLVDRMR